MKNKNLIYLFLPIFLVAIYPLIDSFLYYWILYFGYYSKPLYEAMQTQYSMMDTITTGTMLIMAIPLYKYLTKNKVTTEKLNVKSTLECIPISLAVGGISTLILLFIEKALVPFGILATSFNEFNSSWGYVNNEKYIWVFLSIVFIGPLFEEVFFRGIVYNSLNKFKEGIFPAIVSGILFGLWHAQPVQTSYTIIMGIILGLVYMKTQNLFYPFMIHMLNNLYSTFPPQIDSDFLHSIIDNISIIMVIPFVFFFVLEVHKYNLTKKENLN